MALVDEALRIGGDGVVDEHVDMVLGSEQRADVAFQREVGLSGPLDGLFHLRVGCVHQASNLTADDLLPVGKGSDVVVDARIGPVRAHPGTIATGSTFNFTTTGGLDPATFGLKDGESRDYGTQVQTGAYTVTESAPGPNFALTSVDCSASVLTHGSTVTVNGATASIDLKAEDKIDCTYTNTLQQGAIKITKTSVKGNAPLAGATFEIKDSDGNVIATPTSNANGVACVDHLFFGTYSVRETAAPSGYQIDDPSSHAVTVDNAATCGSGREETVSFSDTPLSRITVSFESLADGNPTSATIDCGSGIDPLPEGTPKVLDDLPPGTYTCTVVVDP